MKKFFNHKKKPYQDWDEADYDAADYDWDEEDAGSEVFEEDGEYDSEDYPEEEYYGEEDAYYAEEDYCLEDDSEEYPEQEDEYYAEDYPEEGYSEEEEAYYTEEDYGEDAYYAEDEEAEPVAPVKGRSAKKGSILTKLMEMGSMDRIVALTGVAVLVLAVITGIVFVSAKMIDKQVSGFDSVGAQLEGIDMIGEYGLLAVADAQVARLVSSGAVVVETHEYDEEEYSSGGVVALDTVSILKDLKIKFTNQRTGKLIANVPFSVSVTDPSGNVYSWVDDDMDGIIYKKDITPGNYSLSVDALDQDKYSDYVLPTTAQKAEVKKEIAYEKVDVKNEVKTESEIDVSKEDTKQEKETPVESTLKDTVQWVESTVTASTYVEVSKSSIADPLTVAVRGKFMRTSESAPGSGTPSSEPSSEPPHVCSDYTWDYSDSEHWQECTETTCLKEKPDSRGPHSIGADGKCSCGYTATPPSAGCQHNLSYTKIDESKHQVTCTLNCGYSTTESHSGGTATCAAPATCSACSQAYGDKNASNHSGGTEVKDAKEATTTAEGYTGDTYCKGCGVKTATGTAIPKKAVTTAAVTVTKASVAVAAGGQDTVTVGGVTSGTYSVISSDTNVATASLSGTTVTIKGVKEGTATITVSATAPGITTITPATVTVTVKGGLSISLDKTAMTVYTEESGAITASIGNGLTGAAVTAETSDAGVATVSVSGTTVTVKGVKAGSATITVKYTESGRTEVKATCAVTVKTHPKNDTNTRLKDTSGNQLYVQVNGSYREATYADYYTNAKFYKQGGAKYTGWQTLDGKVYFFDATGKKVTGEQVIQGAKYNFASDGSLTQGSGTMGIDVSKWNGTIDWNAVKNSGVSYAIIRCGYRGYTQGTLVEDPKFQSNIQGAVNAGLKVGVYFFTQAIDQVEAVQEASMVLDMVEKYKISYPIFLDVESSGGRGDHIDSATRTAVCKAFCETIRDAGYTAGIYANKTWLSSKLDASALSAYKIWLAQYAATPSYKGRYDMWQYTSTGRVSGISGNVDLNISYLGY